jgi:sugar phosphate isomerase/epimerase
MRPGFIDFEPELERLLDEVDESILKICFDTGHHSYAGFDPVAFMRGTSGAFPTCTSRTSTRW